MQYGIQFRSHHLLPYIHGCGIEDVDKAMEPMYTTGTDGRSGMGFSFMEAFMDELTVESEPGVGTVVKMTKKIGTGCAM